ncbi:uncharacterized protein LOC141612947 isoform X2 [Silene latifolia]|uniref:uncharacterized protein LOC141612947 isoform X2 n=1 Tax=Silene latifolia TaxID=37657 RepID=UPI003D76D4F7
MSNLMEMVVYNAAVNGDLTIFSMKNHEKLLKKTYQRNNIIHVAAQHKQIHFIKAALNNFPSIPICESLICDQNRHGNTPFHIAAEVGDEAVIIRLYEFFSTQCGDTDASNHVLPWRVMNEDGNTPAHVALLYGSLSVAMYLLDKDGYVGRLANHFKETLLHLAVQNHVYDNNESQIPETQAPSRSIKVYQSSEDLWSIIERLLKIESSVTCWADTDGSTPLHRAASLEPAYCIQVIKVMLASCPEAAEVHDERSGQTVLHLLTNHQVSSYKQGLELLKIPQVYGVRNSRNHQGNTPLHLAATNRDTIMVRVLLESSPNLGLKNKSGVSAGSLARQLGEVRITKNPKEHTRKLTEEEREAAKQGNVAFLMEQLDSLGMNFLVSQAPKGRNILHILLQRDFNQDLIEEAEEFIGQAIQRLPSLISQPDYNGNTPIHVIVNNKFSLELLDLICKYLVKPREEVEGDSRGGLHLLPWRLKNSKGDTPLHVAVIAINYKFAIKLLELDVEVAGYINNRNQTPLHLISLHEGDYDGDVLDRLISSLINGNADLPYMQDEDGLTPLLIGVQEHRPLIIRRLYERFPDCLEITDFKGRCLWHLFVSRRHARDFLSDDDDDVLKASKFFINQDDNNYLSRRLIESKDNDGNTPLHLAIKNQHFGFAQFFLDNSKLDGISSVRYETLLSIQNKDGVSSFNLLGSAEYIPRQGICYLDTEVCTMFQQPRSKYMQIQ